MYPAADFFQGGFRMIFPFDGPVYLEYPYAAIHDYSLSGDCL